MNPSRSQRPADELKELIGRVPTEEEIAAYVIFKSQKFGSVRDVNAQLRAFLKIDEEGNPLDEDGRRVDEVE